MTIKIELKALELSVTPSHDTAHTFQSSQERYQAIEHAANVLKDHGLIDSAQWGKLVNDALTAYADDLG
ncbi:hypothetical protein [Pseudomonas sp. D2002]|uniref:hypothetical protein n=1 Tax=Pseudomonas sp. D2002 TaxID=2726980 RepID=UPI0015A33A7E|nr:hypothetical protein [Pseudomonas sp. D2002]NWA81574.1 hypothetical protein [Pseudomonas sp. D2002]